MIRFILYFLSRFSVKIKVAFLIIFLISGVLFWNVSYLKDRVEQKRKTEKILDVFEMAQKSNKIISSLEQERITSVLSLKEESAKKQLWKIREQTNLLLSKFKECKKNIENTQNEIIKKKMTLLVQQIGSLEEMRLHIDEGRVKPDEIVYYYTESLINHFIDLLALMTAHIESNDFNAYFNLISAVEYISLEQSLVQVALLRDKKFNQFLYDLIIKQDAKAQTYLERFKTFSDSKTIVAYQKLYSSPSFEYLSKVMNKVKAQVGKKIDNVDIKKWFKEYSIYMNEIKEIEYFIGNTVDARMRENLRIDNEKYNENILFLVLPLFFVLITAWFIFIDIKQSLQTLLTFLEEKEGDRKSRLMLLKSKSELGAIGRTLFAFNKKIKEQIKIIEYNYETDQLTHIPNRNKLLKEMKRMQEAKQNFSIVYIDIHNFSHVNDCFGQVVGDKYLQETAKILRNIAANISINSYLDNNIFRMGSDEFVLICSHVEYINVLIDKLKEIYIIKQEGIDMPLSFTFGIANSDSNYSQVSLLSRAEIASRYAIRTHKRFAYYNEDALLEKRHKANMEWIKKIAEAFSEGLFSVHYQPIARTQTKEILKYEVLIRMYDKDRELMITPAEFLDVLQNSGHEKELTKLIIDQSFVHYDECKVDLSINMTRDDLDSEILDYLGAKISEHNISAESIVIELVESEELLKEKYITIIKEIKRSGFKIAIDDFGTGYSNFAYLTQIKPDFIKIDGSLIQRVQNTIEDRQVVEGICTFAKNLGIKVIAEYVSDEDIYNVVKEIGIEYVQGYYIGHVMSCDEIIKLRGIK